MTGPVIGPRGEFCHIEERPMVEAVAFHLGTQGDIRLLYGPGGRSSIAVQPGHEFEEPPDYTPALVVSQSMARVIYESLSRYYGNETGDTRALRRDYDAERARVDKLTDAMIESTAIMVRR